MSVLTLPEPPGWERGRRGFVWACVGMSAFTALVLYSGIVALLSDQWAPAFAWLAISVMVAMMMGALIIVQSGRTSLRAEQDSSGITFRPDRRFGVLILVGCFIGVVGIVVFVLLLLAGQLDTAMPKKLQSSLIVTAAVGLISAGSAAFAAWRRGGIGYVKVTPRGVDVADMVTTQSCTWDEIDSVADHSDVTKRTRRAVVLSPIRGKEIVIEGADFYIPHGAPLYWMIRHYWRHPEDRMELVDTRARERLRDGRFDLTE